MSETQLDRLERKFDLFVEYVQASFDGVAGQIAELRAEFRADLDQLRNDLDVFRVESREKLENLAQRLTLLERSHITMTGDINDLRASVEDVRLKLSEIGTTVLGTNMGVLELRDDIQQRFRLVNDRLSSLEKKLAA